MNPRNAREVSLGRLARLMRRYPDLPPASTTLDELQRDGLSARDAALAMAIEQSVIRYWNALETIAQSQVNRPWDRVEPDVRAALLGGAAQLLLLDRVPDHAAINETVEWARRHIRPKAGGLVNAVLRRIAELRDVTVDRFDRTARRQLPLPDGGAIQFTADVFDADAGIRLAQQSSHPPALIDAWTKRLGDARARELALHSLVRAPIIVTGIDSDSALGAAQLAPHDEPGFHVLSTDRTALSELLTQHPTARVQDPGSAAPVAATAALDPKIIIDYCAGMGTKTRQLALLHDGATIIATDVNADRLAVLRRTFTGVDRVQVVEPSDIRRWSGEATLLVLDVPCSNSGVLARRLEAKHRFSADSTRSLVNLQRQIIADALPLLAESAWLLYCTCSIEPQENEQQIQWLLRWHDFDVSDQRTSLPNGLPGESPTGYRDGGYYALARR